MKFLVKLAGNMSFAFERIITASDKEREADKNEKMNCATIQMEIEEAREWKATDREMK